MSDGVRVNGRVTIPREELEVRATRSGGPGGQHVNRSATRVEIQWRPATSRSLGDADRARVLERLASRLDSDGFVRVVASDSRSQRQNREAAEDRLAALIRAALVIPKRRVPTRTPRVAKERRLTEKKRRSEQKRSRRSSIDE
ncbi:MAG TPA: alternative ribosome rescue aminoacyl-tRNA hydrolase ArfB [Gemmatimonadaceae bacterium]|nr:alternative ribosome rescue aminoacyl-tRNA hydrolase ArfB [Gemmatimonadaceae bacterium]